MRSGLNQFNNDDSFIGGSCPSCRLAINKETGRLKCVSQVLHYLFSTNFRLNFPYFYQVSDFFAKCRWCTDGSEAWRFCVKLMLLIPAVLLPIIIVCIALSHFQTTVKVSEPQTFSTYGMQEQDKQKIEDDISWCKFGIYYSYTNIKTKLRISIIIDKHTRKNLRFLLNNYYNKIKNIYLKSKIYINNKI